MGNHLRPYNVNSLTLNRAAKEYMTVDETFSPLLHRINQAISQRAVYPRSPISPPAEVLIKWSNPPAELVKASSSQLNRLAAAAGVKKGIFESHNCLRPLF